MEACADRMNNSLPATNDKSGRLATRRSATHWLFSHLIGANGLWIPETALFDDEGVLTTSLYSSPRQQAKTRKLRVANAVIHRRDVLEMGLLRLEARFQDLARTKSPSTRLEKQQHSDIVPPVAVFYGDVEPPRVLDEEALDSVIRELCARERSMTSIEPDVSIARAYPGGRFVLQAATTTMPSSQWKLDTVAIITSFHTSSVAREGFTHDICPTTQYNSEDLQHWTKDVRTLDWSAAFARAEAQCRAVVQHLKTSHGLVIGQLTVEFACSVPVADGVMLTSARLIEWTQSSPSSSPVKQERRQMKARLDDQDHLSVTTRHRPSSYRICRQCRAPIDVDLACELFRQQTIVRDVLAKYQHMSERHADAEVRCRAATDRVAHRETQIVALEAEIVRLQEDLAAQTASLRNVIQQKREMELQLVQVEEQTQKAAKQFEEANDQIHLLQQQQAQEHQSSMQHTLDLQRQWDEQDALWRKQVQALEEEVTGLMATCADLQTQLEETRAVGDELRFQWAFVVRKLTDVSDDGVLPPKRIAGGYSSYPTPTPANIELVVKWIVDYEAKRTVLNAQRYCVSASPPKSTKRRLKLKFELMRLLASGPTAIGSLSPSRSPSHRRPTTRRKSSRSPEKKRTSTSPKRPVPLSDSSLQTTLVFERQTSNT